jgi:DnaJ-class molecular chaperone
MWKWKKKYHKPLKDYYAILGVPRGAPQKTIQQAFRKLAQACHPDRDTSADAKERFQELVEAYQVLKAPDKRDEFDARVIAEFCDSFIGSFSEDTGEKKKQPKPELYRILGK